MIDSLLIQSWFKWGVVILFSMPIAVVIAGELIFLLEKRASIFLDVVKNIRNFLLPSLFFFLLFDHVLQLEESSLVLKLVETTFYILLIHSALKLINTLVFSNVLPLHIQDSIPKLLIDFLRGFLVLLGASFVFSYVWGADIGKLLAALGVGSIVLGFALQDVLGGVFSGLALLSSRPFVVGDWIQIGELEGKVVNIDWRAVTLRNRDNDLVIVPNSQIASEQLFNFSHTSPIHREIIDFNISFEHAPNKVIKVLRDIVGMTPEILKDPKPSALLVAYGEFSICYQVTYYITNYANKSNIRSNFNSKVWYALRRNNIRFALREAQVEELPAAISHEEIYDVLKNLSVLDINDKDLRKLTQHCQLLKFGKGECVLEKNEIPEVFSIIVQGRAKESAEYLKGTKTNENIFSRGDFFGMSGIANRENKSSSIYATEDLVVIAIDIAYMRDMLYKNAQVAESLEAVIKAQKKVQLSKFEVEAI